MAGNNPKSRNEALLQNVLGESYDIGKPKSRVEALLNEIIEQGGGGGNANSSLIAPDYDASSTYSEGDYVIYEKTLYIAKQDIDTAEEWTPAHWDESDVVSELDKKISAPSTAGTSGQVLTSDGHGGEVWANVGSGTIVVDSTLTVQNAAADAKAVGDKISNLKNAFDDEIGYSEVTTPTPTYTDGYAIMSSGAQIGTIVESSSNSVTDKISVSEATKLFAYYTGSNPYGTVFFYDINDTYLDKTSFAAQSSATEFTIPENTNYIRWYCMTSRKANVHVTMTAIVQGEVYEALDEKLNKNQGAANAGKILAIDNTGEIVPSLPAEKSNPIYMKSRPCIPLMPEMCADFAWCSMVLPSALTGKNVVLTVSGTQGSTELSVSNITEVEMSDLDSDIWIGGVLTTDGIAYKVYNFKYKTANSIEIFPALEESITNATLATLMYDSGESYVGLHLTEDGYKAYAYYLYNTNPKHCEVSKYIAAFRPYLDGESIPFTEYGTGTDKIYTDIYTSNRNNQMLEHYTGKYYRFLFNSSYTPAEEKRGIEWEVDLKGKSGYIEIFINAISNALTLPTGQEIYVDLYLDGVRTQQSIITDKIGKRIVLDYENAETGKIDIYCNKWTPIDNLSTGFRISRICWWINELDYETPLFPKGSVIAQEFDSWGVFHDGMSGVALSALHDDATGVSVPYTNHSLGNQTSAWGKAWFYENVWKYNPSISITDFVINDANSVDNTSIPNTILGPDNKLYNNKITKADYCANQKTIINEAIFNDIQPILMRACQHGSTGYIGFTLAFIDDFATEVT